RLFHNIIQPEDFIDEKDVPCNQAVQNRSQVTHTYQDGTRGNPEDHLHLIGDNSGQRCLTQPRRRIKEAMIQRLLALAHRFDEDAQVLFHPLLTDKLPQRLGPEGLLDGFFFRSGLSHQGCCAFVHESCFSASLIRSAVAPAALAWPDKRSSAARASDSR